MREVVVLLFTDEKVRQTREKNVGAKREKMASEKMASQLSELGECVMWWKTEPE